MKTKEELNALKEEVETVSKKLHELTDEELAQVSGSGRERYILPIDLHPCEYNNETCPYKDDYTKCPDRDVSAGCRLLYKF